MRSSVVAGLVAGFGTSFVSAAAVSRTVSGYNTSTGLISPKVFIISMVSLVRKFISVMSEPFRSLLRWTSIYVFEIASLWCFVGLSGSVLVNGVCLNYHAVLIIRMNSDFQNNGSNFSECIPITFSLLRYCPYCQLNLIRFKIYAPAVSHIIFQSTSQ